MSNEELIKELEKSNIHVTPSAIEVLNNSNVPVDMLIQDLKKLYKGKTKPLTVKNAIDLMLNSDKYVQFAKKLRKELKTRTEDFIDVPRKYRRSYYTLKRINEPVSAGQVANRTKRKTATEKQYLDFLVSTGFVTKIQTENNKILYLVV